jgi:predicted dehydrogenase
MRRIKWGILSTAKIGIRKVIPAMQKGCNSEILAIASRSAERAGKAAEELKIPRAYGSYQSLLADPDIEAVYIPLPNHLHVPWSVKALEAGKHVLCEKPIALTTREAEYLVSVSRRYPDLKIMEAFMYRYHPQWYQARDWVSEGRIGSLTTIHSFFSYFNDDPADIRNRLKTGGGGLMDIGCYSISLSRYLFGAEPDQVTGMTDRDPRFGTDRLFSGLMRFGKRLSSFTCSTQLAAYQRVHIFGTKGRIEIEIPFNAPNDRETRIWLSAESGIEEKRFPVCDQYTIQGDLFSLSILRDESVPTPLSDAAANMRVIEALIQSAESGSRVLVQ